MKKVKKAEKVKKKKVVKKKKKKKKKKKGSCELEGGVVNTSLSSRCEGPFLKLNLNFEFSIFNFQLWWTDINMTFALHGPWGPKGKGERGTDQNLTFETCIE